MPLIHVQNDGARGLKRRARTTMTALLAGLLGSLLLLLGLAPAANAHDVMTGSEPTDAQVLNTAPAEVTLHFSANPIALGSSVSVKDAAGSEWAEGEVDIVDNVVTQKLKADMPGGNYTVNWRVVSSDSHPVEKTFTFTVKAPASAGNEQPIATQTPAAAPAQQSADDQFPFLIVIFAAVGVALLVILGLMARKRLKNGEQD